MTEAEWLTCTDPTLMLVFLEGKASDRKLRLFSCACCSRIWRLIRDERGREAIRVAEQFADGTATEAAREAAHAVAGDVPNDPTPCLNASAADGSSDAARSAFAVSCAALTAGYAARSTAAARVPILSLTRRIIEAAGYATFDISDPEFVASKEADENEKAAQCGLLCDVIGNPFQPSVADPRWLSAPVLSMTRLIHDAKWFRFLPLLADILEEAGCTDRLILDHCRGPGPHVWGCWVVDLILGKK